jgi:hypothetical protein
MKQTTTILFFLLSIASYAQEVISYKLSECDSYSNVDLVRRRIVSKVINNDTLTLRIGFVENCCLYPKPETSRSNDTLFLSMENVSDVHCACDCCFEMDIKVFNTSDTNFVLMWGDYELNQQSKYPKLPHEYHIDENTPINKLNGDSLKIGLWYEYRESTGRKCETYYDLNPNEKSNPLWTRVYDQNGGLIEIAIRQGESGDLIIFEPYDYSRTFEK